MTDDRDLVISALAKMVRNEYDGLDDEANIAALVERWWVHSSPSITEAERAAVSRYFGVSDPSQPSAADAMR